MELSSVALCEFDVNRQKCLLLPLDVVVLTKTYRKSRADAVLQRGIDDVFQLMACRASRMSAAE
ncbi:MULTISPECIES: hypothetical protein [Comamonas]|uniref:hypothetical protein n=1 Tax=Comamonas TaxID=283 RepID=UPI0012C24AAE|nr:MULTISPECIES: hypothetical protein [Comamonas]MDN5506526.1 hypothetical protein [Comamonas sp.]MDN5538035.1 hypothetical protein [Comamonas sp.]MPT09452.1 hypothetical protein [Comamonas sp.]